MSSRTSEAFADSHPQNQHFFAVDEIDIELWRNFVIADLEPVLHSSTKQEFITVTILVFYTWSDIKFPRTGMVGKRHCEHPEFQVTEGPLHDRANTERR